jgi:hypothetical protein
LIVTSFVAILVSTIMIKELEIKELVIKPQTIPTAGPRWFIEGTTI